MVEVVSLLLTDQSTVFFLFKRNKVRKMMLTINNVFVQEGALFVIP